MRLRAIVVLAAIVGLCSACSSDPRRDIVIVTLDTLRADRLGCYGNDDGLTPSLDRFAERATLFERAVAPTPITLPTHASLFTGRYPSATGVRNNGTFVLPDAEHTLAETLRDAGWQTAAVVAAYPLHSRFGLAQGFERYDDQLPPPPRTNNIVQRFFSERNASEVTARALRAWDAMGTAAPRFLWVHYFDPHQPHDAPEPFSRREEVSTYDHEVAYLDSEIGVLLQQIADSSPHAIVIIAADHGESLGEHGEDSHGIFIYESTLKIPLLLRAPGLFPPGRIQTPVSLVDIVPTVLALVGVPIPSGVQGADLRPLPDGEPVSRPLYAESYLPHLEYRLSPLTMIRDGDLKYVAAPSPELYDLAADPGENVNLHGRHPEEDRLAGELAAFLAAADRTSTSDARVELDDEAAEHLRSLGYLSGGATTIEPRASSGRDPKEMIEYIQREDKAIEMIAAGKVEEGLARLRQHVAEVPENYVSRFRVATLLRSVGQESEAELELQTVLAEDPEFYPAVLELAKTHAALGKLDAAIAGFRRAADLAPTLAKPHHELGMTLESYGRYDAAAAAYSDALALEPTSFELARAILALRDGRGDLAVGVDEIRAVSVAHPRSAPLWTVIAEGSMRLGRLQEAAAAIRRARELDPDLHDARLVDGDLHLRAGRADQAERIFRGLLASSPLDGPARFGLARALLAQDRLREADVELGIVLEFDPGYSAAHTVRGEYLEQRGDARAAAGAYRLALSVNPGDRRAAEGLARVQFLSAPQ